MADYTLSAKVTAEISGFQKNMQTALKSLESFSKACQNIGKTLQDFGNGLTTLGKKLAAVETAVTGVAFGGISKCVKEFATFEDEITRVAALAKATPEDFEKISEKAKEMGATTRYTSTQAAEAMEYMAMAGWKTQDMLDGIEPVMNLATAAGENLAEVSDIVTDGLTAFGMEAKDAERFTDVLAAAATSANTNVHMMGESLKYAGTVAGAMGYSIEDISVALGLMGNSAVKSGQAGTYLRGIITNLLNPSTEEAAALMEEYQISLKDSEGNLKSFDDVMINLRQAFSAMEDAEKTSNAEILVGQRAMTGLLAIVNASDKDFNEMTAAIADSSGACQELSDKMNDTLVGKFEILKSGISAIKNTIGEQFAPTMYDLVDKAQGVVNTIQNMIDAFIAAKNQGNALDGIAAAVQTILPALQAMNGAGNLPGILQELPGIAQKLIDKLHGLSSEGKTLQDFTGIFAKIALIPPALIAAGSSVSAFGSVFSGIGSTINTANSIFGNIQGLLSSTAKNISGTATVFGDSFKKISNSFTNTKSFQNFSKGISKVFQPAKNDIRIFAGFFKETVKENIQSTFDKLPNVLQKSLNKTGSILGNSGGMVKDSLGVFGTAFGQLFSGLAKGALPFANVLMNCFGFGAIAGLVLVGLGLIQQNFGDKINEILETVKTKAPSIIENFVAGITDKIPDLIASGSELIQNLLDVLITLAPALIAGGSAILISLAQGFADALPGMLEKVGELIVVIVNELTTQLPAFLETGMNILFALVEGIAGVLPDLIPAAVDMILTLVLGLLDQLPKLIDCALDLIMTLADGLLAALPKLIEKLPEIITKIVNTLIEKAPAIIEAGAELIRKLADGLSEAIPNLLGRIPGMLQDIKDKFLETDWSEVGKSIMTAITNGLISVANLAISVLNGLIDAANWIPGVDIPNIPEIPHFAHGTDNFKGGYAVINENNKGEIVNLPDGSQVIPHDISEQYAKTAARNTAESVFFIDYTAIGEAVAMAMGSKEIRTTVELDGQKMGETLTPIVNRRLARNAILMSRT